MARALPSCKEKAASIRMTGTTERHMASHREHRAALPPGCWRHVRCVSARAQTPAGPGLCRPAHCKPMAREAGRWFPLGTKFPHSAGSSRQLQRVLAPSLSCGEPAAVSRTPWVTEPRRCPWPWREFSRVAWKASMLRGPLASFTHYFSQSSNQYLVRKENLPGTVLGSKGVDGTKTRFCLCRPRGLDQQVNKRELRVRVFEDNSREMSPLALCVSSGWGIKRGLCLLPSGRMILVEWRRLNTAFQEPLQTALAAVQTLRDENRPPWSRSSGSQTGCFAAALFPATGDTWKDLETRLLVLSHGAGGPWH